MVMKKFFGDRAFYKRVLAISTPIIIQNGITNFVNLLDNVMVGALGTEAMSGVSIVNQFVFIFNLLIFGAMSAGGIFTAQYHGRGDVAGVRNTFRIKLLISVILGILGVAVFMIFDDALISTFLHAGESSGDLELTLTYGREYLAVFVIGLIPYAVSQSYASTLRETGDTVIPMYSSVIALVCNCCLNYVFIFLLSMGVRGAAVATVIAQFSCMIVSYIYMYRRYEVFRFRLRDLRPYADKFRLCMKLAIPTTLQHLVVSLGNVALQAFVKDVIGSVHGAWQRVVVAPAEKKAFTLPLFPLYHPASIIYNRSLAATYQEDLQKLKQSLRVKSDIGNDD